MGSGKGITRRVQTTAVQRQAAIRKASIVVRSGRVMRAGSSEVKRVGSYILRKEPDFVQNSAPFRYCVVDGDDKDFVETFNSLQKAEERIQQLNETDPRETARREAQAKKARLKQEAQDELSQLERVGF